MKMKLSKWFYIDSALALISGITSILGIFTGVAASNDQKNVEYKELEDRYGLTPVSKEETN